MARMTRSSPCPMFTDISWLLKSMNRLPSGVQKWTPFARATGIGSTLDCADHSNIVCFRVRATSSSPVSGLGSAMLDLRRRSLHGRHHELRARAAARRPSRGDGLEPRVEVDALRAVNVMVAEQGALPSAEAVEGHRHRDGDVH